MTHTVKGFCVVNETEVDVFLEFPCFLYEPTDVGNLISGSYAFSKTSLNIWMFSIWTHIYGIYNNGNNNPICETAKETQMYRTVFWTLWEKARVGWFERIPLKHVYYHMWNMFPVQVQCMRQVLRAGARGWPKGWDGEEGGRGFRMGNTSTPTADSCQCMPKTTTVL